MDLRDKILKRQNKNDNEIFEKAKVSILGCGGLGSNVAMILARAGIGEIFLYDFDKVEYSNLNRQNYKISDIGKEKVLATKKINNITMVGDFKSDAKKDGLYLAYVSIMASLEALECLKKIRKDYYGR